jgi:hypothetical protein
MVAVGQYIVDSAQRAVNLLAHGDRLFLGIARLKI